MRPPTGDCAVVRELLPEYALNLLDSDEAIRVRQHLDTCGTCRTDHDELADVVAILRGSLTTSVVLVSGGPHSQPPASSSRRPRRAPVPRFIHQAGNPAGPSPSS